MIVNEPHGNRVSRQATSNPMRPAISGYDLLAALALAAVAIPEQIATARLAGMPAATGLIVFVAASLGFFLFGSNRYISAGADSTIAPIFAASLALLGTMGSPHYFGLAAALALLVGLTVTAGGILHMGWIARLLSIPVITGFLAGIAIHIAISQLPALLGITGPHGELFSTMSLIASKLAQLNVWTVVIGLGVFGATFFAEKIDVRIPGALIAMILATLCVFLFGLADKGVAVLGAVQPVSLRPSLPGITLSDLGNLLPMAMIVSLLVIIQTATTSRSFPNGDDTSNLNRDLIGVGIANILSGGFGGFCANSSPPRTAVVSESGGRSRFAGLFAAAIVGLFLIFGLSLLAGVPQAALSGLLLFVALRIFRIGVMRDVFRQSPMEFVLLLATAAAIVMMPIQTGVAFGITLSLLYGVWTTTRARAVEFERVPNSTVWWPVSRKIGGERLAGVVVVGFQAPLSFLNADAFRQTLEEVVKHATQPVHTIVLEASSIIELDFSGAQTLMNSIKLWQSRGVKFCVARLESLRAQEAFEKFGISELLGQNMVFHSVDAALRAGAVTLPA